jgi:hypothetical protein
MLIPVVALALMLTGCSSLATTGGAAPRTEEPGASAAPAAGQQVLPNGTVVDNIRLGVAVDCGLVAGSECTTALNLATTEAAARHNLASTSIGAAHFYLPYSPPGAVLGGGSGYVVVLDLADGSQAAVYVYCLDKCQVIPPQPVRPMTLASPDDHGPTVDPMVNAPVDCASPDHATCNEALQVAFATATSNGFLAPATIANAHYYITYVIPGSPEAASSKAEYIVHFYVAGASDTLAETSVGVSCQAGPCQAVSPSP